MDKKVEDIWYPSVDKRPDKIRINEEDEQYFVETKSHTYAICDTEKDAKLIKEALDDKETRTECECGCGLEGDTFTSAKDIIKICEDNLSTLGLRRLPGGQRRGLREEDFQ